MFSKFNNFFSETNIDAAPSPSEISSVASENNYEHKPVEVRRSRPPAASSLFEPVEKQRHFGILRYTVNKRFNKLMLIGLLNVILIAGVLLLVFLVFLKSNESPSVAATTTTVPPPRSMCTPLDNTTFLFAYSNDFDQAAVSVVLQHVDTYHITSMHYSNFGSIRFDVKNPENFTFSSNWTDVRKHIHLPDPSLGYDHPIIGSDILTMIDRFLDVPGVPVCGSRIFIFVKRYPNNVTYTKLVDKLKEYHSYLSLLVSRSPSGGDSGGILYEIATKTNGICGFDEDELMGAAVTYIETSAYPNLLYAVNPTVSGHGRIQLKSLKVFDFTPYTIAMTVQDDGPMDVVKNVTFSWTQGTSVGSIGTTSSPEVGNHLSLLMNFDALTYTMQLDYDYSDTLERTLQIRIFGSDYTSMNEQWQPYDN